MEYIDGCGWTGRCLQRHSGAGKDTAALGKTAAPWPSSSSSSSSITRPTEGCRMRGRPHRSMESSCCCRRRHRHCCCCRRRHCHCSLSPCSLTTFPFFPFFFSFSKAAPGLRWLCRASQFWRRCGFPFETHPTPLDRRSDPTLEASRPAFRMCVCVNRECECWPGSGRIIITIAIMSCPHHPSPLQSGSRPDRVG